MGNLNLNLTHVKADDVFIPIPEGRYDVIIDDAEVVQAKTSGADMLKVTFRIINHDNFNGRKLWSNFTLGHEIGQKMLKNLAVAIDHPNPNMIADTNEFICGKCSANVKLETGGAYGDQNKVTSYKKMANAAPVQPQTQQQQPSQHWNPVNEALHPAAALIQQQPPVQQQQQQAPPQNQQQMPWGQNQPQAQQQPVQQWQQQLPVQVQPNQSGW